MNIAERIVAGPPVLATVARRAAKGDVVYDLDESDILEVVQVGPSIVGAGPNLVLKSLYNGVETTAYPREVVVLTKAEAAEVRAHIAANWSA